MRKRALLVDSHVDICKSVSKYTVQEDAMSPKKSSRNKKQVQFIITLLDKTADNVVYIILTIVFAVIGSALLHRVDLETLTLLSPFAVITVGVLIVLDMIGYLTKNFWGQELAFGAIALSNGMIISIVYTLIRIRLSAP